MVVVYRHREHAADPKPKPKPKPKPSSLVVVVYRHREHAGALGLLARVEARHVRVLERLVRDRGFGFGLIVGRGCWAPDCAYCDCADHASTYYLYLLPLLTTSAYYLCVLPLLTRSLLDVGPLLGVEVHEPLNQVDRLGYIRLQAGMHTVAGWDAYGCRLGCTRLQPEHTRYSLVTYGYTLVTYGYSLGQHSYRSERVMKGAWL